MVMVEYSIVDHGDIEEHLLTLDGHADYGAVPGSNIVCAGISAIVQALVAMLDHHKDGYEADIIEKGKVEVAYRCAREDVKTNCIFQMAMEGLELLAENYPENITVG